MSHLLNQQDMILTCSFFCASDWRGLWSVVTGTKLRRSFWRELTGSSTRSKFLVCEGEVELDFLQAWSGALWTSPVMAGQWAENLFFVTFLLFSCHFSLSKCLNIWCKTHDTLENKCSHTLMKELSGFLSYKHLIWRYIIETAVIHHSIMPYWIQPWFPFLGQSIWWWMQMKGNLALVRTERLWEMTHTSWWRAAWLLGGPWERVLLTFISEESSTMSHPTCRWN